VLGRTPTARDRIGLRWGDFRDRMRRVLHIDRRDECPLARVRRGAKGQSSDRRA
jgi:hypothetical protein